VPRTKRTKASRQLTSGQLNAALALVKEKTRTEKGEGWFFLAKVSPRVKASLERLYAAADAPKEKIRELEVKKMTKEEVEDEIVSLTNELSAQIEEIKRRSFNEGVRAALQRNAILSGTDASAAAVSSVPASLSAAFVPAPAMQAQPPAQTNVIIETPASAAALKKHDESARASEKSERGEREFEAKLSILNDKLDEVDGALASIHEMQIDLQKTQAEVQRAFAAKLDEFTALTREASDYVEGVRAVASRMNEVGARLSDALEENARANAAAAAREAPTLSLEPVNEKLSEVADRLDSLAEKTASKELQKENSRLLESQGIELSSLKSALKKQLKSVRRASKRITRVSRELEEVEGAVKRAGRKTTRTVKRVAAELGAETKSAKRFAKKAKSKATQAANAAEAVKPAAKKIKKTLARAKAGKTSKAGKASKSKR
jgi:DNA repair exonuclease SbcCD ATPase subunit